MLYVCHEEKTIPFAGCWLPSAKFCCYQEWQKGPSQSDPDRANSSVLHAGLPAGPGGGWASDSGALGQLLLLCQGTGVSFSRDAQACHSSTFDFLLLHLSHTFSPIVSLLFPFGSCFPYYSLCSFLPISSPFSLLPSLFLWLFPLAFCQTTCTTFSFSGYFSQGLNHSSSVCLAICRVISHSLGC